MTSHVILLHRVRSNKIKWDRSEMLRGLVKHNVVLSIGRISTLICSDVLIKIQELGDSVIGDIFCHKLQNKVLCSS